MTTPQASTSQPGTRAWRAALALSFTATVAGCATPAGLLADGQQGRLAGPAAGTRVAAGERTRYIVLELPPATLPAGQLAAGARLVWNGLLLRVEADGRVAVPERLLAAPGEIQVVIEGVGSARLQPDQLQNDRLVVPEAALQALTPEAERAAFDAARSASPARMLGPEWAAEAGVTTEQPPESQLPTAEQLRLAPIKLTEQAALSASGHLGALAALGREAEGQVTFGAGGLTLAQLLLAPAAATYDTRTGQLAFQGVEGYPAALEPGASGRSTLEQGLYGSGAAGRGVIVGGAGGVVVSGSGSGALGGASQAPTGGAPVGPGAGGLVSDADTGLLGPDGGSLAGQPGGALIGPDGGSLSRQARSGLIGLDGGSLAARTGASLIGPDGGTLVGPDGGSLIADRGAGLLADRGAGLIGLDGGTLVNTGAAAMMGYPYFPSAGLGPAKLHLLMVGVPAAPLERTTSGGVREVLLPEQTRVRAVDTTGKPLTEWTRTGPTGAFQLGLPPTVPVVFFVVAESRVPGSTVQRATALAFAPGARERPLVVPVDSATTLVTTSLAFLLDYVPREIARLEALLETLPPEAPGYAVQSEGERDDDDRDDDDDDDGDEDREGDGPGPRAATVRQLAQKRLGTLREARESFNVLYYGVDTQAAEPQLGPEAAQSLSTATSLEAGYEELRTLVRGKRLKPRSFKAVAPKSPLEISP
ncbi:MAG: hypothetical protein VKQ33_07095 [Candidatus Sericytochromatia bacterium]|nr:hypothetical protein [Candidatus Sericytochromatia bacterium]